VTANLLLCSTVFFASAVRSGKGGGKKEEKEKEKREMASD